MYVNYTSIKLFEERLNVNSRIENIVKSDALMMAKSHDHGDRTVGSI